jgi:hypothetical protein
MAEPDMRHLEEDLIERYSMGRVEEPELSALEEHLLICSRCQDQVEAEDRFARAARAALSRPESAVREFRSRWSFLTGRWAGLAYAGAVLLAAYFLLPAGVNAPAAQIIPLRAVRGPSASGVGRARAALQLKLLDTNSLAPGSYTAEIADAQGGALLRQEKEQSAGELILDVRDGLPAGKYWVRLYRGPDLVREYGLTLQ